MKPKSENILKGLFMKRAKAKSDLAQQIHQFIRKGFTPQFGKLSSFKSNPVWQVSTL
jgi:hypothetical protein